MDDQGRDMSAFERMAKASERQADAAEALLKIAENEQLVMVEPGPSICPHCGAINPIVTPVADDGGSGKIDSFVLIAETHCCNKVIFAVPREWAIVTNAEHVQQLSEMKGGSDNGRTGTDQG